ncbi:hypothetical protein SI859A1_01383 [Aurantimonas manganoxydans SI85-9A1]|uniref:Uncharacterized protein n=1 Tax=Aurantimonas manganoxydans (strain ATCC BAA-1229 / DSM 21871 / SI85-9A1) TaxID=287752 RepID=Q1YIT7_AURMS|nr:hypothetical protein SI859A1_01383 [Aurantimonas manganoxydans SI85-9A1]
MAFLSIQRSDQAAQHVEERGLARPDDGVQFPVVTGGAFGQMRQLLTALVGQVQTVAAAIGRARATPDQHCPVEIAQHRRQGGLVAAGRPAQRQRRDARIVVDQRQQGEMAGPQIGLRRMALESLERGVLRNLQMKGDVVVQRATADRIVNPQGMVRLRGLPCR